MFYQPFYHTQPGRLLLIMLLIWPFALDLPTVQAQTKAVKMTICQEIDGRKPGENTGAGLRALKPANSFEFGGVDSFAVLLEFPAFNEPQRIDIAAFHSGPAGEYKNFGTAVIISRTDTKAYVIGTFSQVGKHIVKAILDEKVIAQETFEVTDSPNPPRAQLLVCKDVDGNLNPVGAATTFSPNSAVKFHAAFPRHNGQRFIFWTIYKIGDDGTDESFVDGYEMGVKAEWKTFATEETHTLTEPGKYRLYLLDYEQGNSSVKEGNYKRYLAKTDITVK